MVLNRYRGHATVYHAEKKTLFVFSVETRSFPGQPRYLAHPKRLIPYTQCPDRVAEEILGHATVSCRKHSSFLSSVWRRSLFLGRICYPSQKSRHVLMEWLRRWSQTFPRFVWFALLLFGRVIYTHCLAEMARSGGQVHVPTAWQQTYRIPDYLTRQHSSRCFRSVKDALALSTS